MTILCSEYYHYYATGKRILCEFPLHHVALCSSCAFDTCAPNNMRTTSANIEAFNCERSMRRVLLLLLPLTSPYFTFKRDHLHQVLLLQGALCYVYGNKRTAASGDSPQWLHHLADYPPEKDSLSKAIRRSLMCKLHSRRPHCDRDGLKQRLRRPKSFVQHNQLAIEIVPACRLLLFVMTPRHEPSRWDSHYVFLNYYVIELLSNRRPVNHYSLNTVTLRFFASLSTSRIGATRSCAVG